MKDGKAASLADRLARDIQAARFEPGSWLKQIALQERYQANRSEIRKALERLAGKRMIRYEPNRGYFVHSVDGHLSDDIRDIRIILETGAAEQMVARATDAQIEEMDGLAEAFAASVDRATLLDVYEINLAFHRALLATAGNESLVELVSELRLRTSPAPASQWSTGQRIEQSAREHFEMVDALGCRDAAGLREVIGRHIGQPPFDGLA